MKTKAQDGTTQRLKAVLDVLADRAQGAAGGPGSAVLAEAIARVPLNERESELLSGGVPRGFKTLTTASAKLVKAGWMVKGRSGWTITEEGLRATVAFPDEESFASALAAGTPVPADTPLPAASAPADGADGAAEDAGEGAPAEAESGGHTSAAEQHAGQPAAVAIAGNFGSHLGAAEDWAPHFDEVQMVFDQEESVWKITTDLPAGAYSYKVAIDRSWVENYGAFGVRDGSDHELHHPGGQVTFRYDHATKDVSTT
ncbi:glycosidase [Arthrobacter zhaoguopingii]|uniref:pullulanase X25 domain-containing protein n=1 Tax=Arthrobacter zhaoguopingii TaxID=2681491 RepID=UPI003CCD20C8